MESNLCVWSYQAEKLHIYSCETELSALQNSSTRKSFESKNTYFSFKEGELDTFDQIGATINKKLQAFVAYVWIVRHSSTCYKQISG